MMRQLTLETPICRNPKALWRGFEHETAIIVPESNAVRTLNEVGTRFWELADGRTLGEIISLLTNEFDVSSDELEVDLRKFVAELDARNLLIWQEP